MSFADWQTGVGQSSYEKQPNPGAVGEIAYGPDATPKVESFTASQNDLPFGQMMARVSGKDGECDFPASGTDEMVGFTVRDLQRVNGLYDKSAMCAIMSAGRIWVTPEEVVAVGDPVYIRYAGKKQVQTIVFSADIVASNSIAGVVAGTALTATVFDTNNATTLTALAAKIAAQPNITSAASDGTRTITVTSDQDETIALTGFVVTLGASQATVEITETTAGIPLADRGKVRNDADSSTCVKIPQARFLTSTASFSSSSKRMAIVDLNWPQVSPT